MFKINSKNEERALDNKGYTLIEVMIAIVIFAVGILAIYSMHITSINSNFKARAVTQEANWAVDRIEKLMQLPYPDAILSAGDHSVDAGTFTQATDGIDNNADGEIDEAGETGPIDISWTVQDDVPDLNTKYIVVTVTQRMPLASDRSVTFDFIKADF